MKVKQFNIILLMLGVGLLAQEKEVAQDSLSLEELVYTGQVSPQEVNKSVYEITVINAEQIEQSAALNLADLLNQSLNINITPNASTGKSGLSMLGLNSEYVKVLIDNVPVINDEGLGNFTDFTQINLGDIEQIEIAEGAMGVDYGADAVAGVINIITKKTAGKKMKANIYVQEESIGDEYNFDDKGRHITGIDISKKIFSKLNVGITYNQNKFNGFYDGKKGKEYSQNDGLRGYTWLPKQQYYAKTFLSYRLNRVKLSYNFNFFQEEIQNYNDAVIEGYNPQFDLYFPTAQDIEYKTKRWYHLLNASGNAWEDATFNLSLSYQKQDRDANFYTYNILENTTSDENKFTYESRNVIYGKGMLQQIFSEHWKMQLGTEINSIKGTQSPLARSVDSSTETQKRELGSYDVFASSDISLSNKVTVRPGIRALFSSQFNSAYAYSLSTSYFFGSNWELRAIYGKTPKAPTYEQLYTYFVDSNHDIRGNENLNPEIGQSVSLYLKKESKIINNVLLKSKLGIYYLKVKDKIGLYVVESQPLRYEYKNFENYTSQGVNLENSLRTKRLTTSLGLSLMGTSYESDNRDMLYTLKGNLLFNYRFPKAGLSVATNIKYNGPEYSWVYDADLNDLVKGKLNDYTWWDLYLRKKVHNNIEVAAGIRNLTNVINVKTTATSDGAHSVGGTTEMRGYGRSYFLKLTYNIPF